MILVHLYLSWRMIFNNQYKNRNRYCLLVTNINPIKKQSKANPYSNMQTSHYEFKTTILHLLFANVITKIVRFGKILFHVENQPFMLSFGQIIMYHAKVSWKTVIAGFFYILKRLLFLLHHASQKSAQDAHFLGTIQIKYRKVRNEKHSSLI